MTVSELTASIQQRLEPHFERVEVEGEISNLHRAQSGHVYFTLKDAAAMIQAASFNHARGYRGAPLTEGMQVRIYGRVAIYAKRGSYQIICSRIEQVGYGEILALLERRKQALAAAGLFDQAHKQPLPRFVHSIALITSLRGAAIRDFLTVTRRRNDGINIIVVPSLVQGEEAAAQVCERIAYINRHALAQIIVITRGGGSLEDLLPFSDEQVVHAVYQSRIPIVAAIGHEIDTALCELAADVRASTPSVAAELVSIDKQEVAQYLTQQRAQLSSAMSDTLKQLRTHLDHYQPPRLHQAMMNIIHHRSMTLDADRYKVQMLLRELLEKKRTLWQHYRDQLRVLSPTAILQRGFAIVQEQKTGVVVVDSTSRQIGDALTVRLAKGAVAAKVTAIEPAR